MFRFLFLFAVAVLGFSAYGQLEKDYEPLKCEGQIPEVFISLVNDSYDDRLEDHITKDDNRFSKKSKDKFVLNSTSFVKEILGSGKVLFGDPVSIYLNKVKDNILRDDKDLRDRIVVYPIKSSVANAFSTDQGIIFVTTGLMAQIVNEAQLAFVLCHEISHVVKKHTINQFIEQEKINSSKGIYNQISFDEALEQISNYSQENEFEADLEGMKLFFDTDYKRSEILSMFQVLVYSYLPFDEVKFDYEFLERESFQFSDEWKLEKVKEIEVDIDYEDKYLSHPNILKRKKRIEDEMDDQGENLSSGKYFVVAENEFHQVRELCRFETVRLNLINTNYVRAIYHTYLLMDKYPDNKFLNYALGKAFYGLYKFKKKDHIHTIFTNANKSHTLKGDSQVSQGAYKDIQGHEQAVAYLISNLNRIQLGILSLRYFREYEESYGSNKFLDQYEYDLIHDLIKKDELRFRKFKTTSLQEKMLEMDQNLSDLEKDTSDLNKYEKIKKNNESDNVKNYITKSFQWHILGKYVDDSNLKEKFDEIEKEVDEEKKLEEEQTNYASSGLIYKRNKWEYKWGDFLGINDVITINPFYLRETEKKGPIVLESEERQIWYSERIKKNSEELGIDNDILNPQMFSPDDVDKFNDLAVINEWMLEKVENIDVDMYPLSSDYVEDQIDKYNTSNIFFSGVVNYKEKKQNVWALILFGVIVYPMLPYYIYLAVSPLFETLNFHFIFDMSNGKTYLANVDYYKKQVDAKIFIESKLYAILYQIKNLPRKPEP